MRTASRLARLLTASAVSAGVAAGLAALPLAPASAIPMLDWRPYESTGLVSVVSVVPGTLEGRDGNWHTVVLSVNGDDGVTGKLVDWTCAPGVRPNFQDLESEWLCLVEDAWDLSTALDEENRPLTQVTVDRGARRLVVQGEVLATDYAGGSSLEPIRVIARARGSAVQDVVRTKDGALRQVTVIRDHSKARGRVLGVRLNEVAATVEASSVVAITTFLRPSA